MASELEVRERQKNHLGALLKLKRLNDNSAVKGLDELIIDAVMPMEQEDVSWVEKLTGVKAM